MQNKEHNRIITNPVFMITFYNIYMLVSTVYIYGNKLVFTEKFISVLFLVL